VAVNVSGSTRAAPASPCADGRSGIGEELDQDVGQSRIRQRRSVFMASSRIAGFVDESPTTRHELSEPRSLSAPSRGSPGSSPRVPRLLDFGANGARPRLRHLRRGQARSANDGV